MRVYVISRQKLILMLVPMMAIVYCALALLFSGQSLAGKIIVVDAGHGGIDPGANRPGVLEKDINLAIALEMRQELKSRGAEVVLTRETDQDLSGLCDNDTIRKRYQRDLNARHEMIQENAANLFVSIHANASSKPQHRGTECYYFAKSEQGKALALAIQEQLAIWSPMSQGARPADFFVLRNSEVPATLIEVGFITNQDEKSLLQSPQYQRKLAQAIAQGIVNYFSTQSSKLTQTGQ